MIITRNIDLSIGSILCLSTYLCGFLFYNVPGIPIPVVVAIGILLGAFLGLINGLLVAFLKVPSLVITLGTLYAYRGIAILWIGPHFIRSSWTAAISSREAVSIRSSPSERVSAVGIVSFLPSRC